MRKVFINTLIDIASKDERIYLLTGDIGFSVLETFKEKFPDRFFNMGVAEQNMIGVAAGMALEGKIVFVYSIVPFVTLRCYEQIRNDVCLQNLNVRIIGTGGGVSYGTAGATHYALEDFSIMRSLVNMSVISPGNSWEMEETVKASVRWNGPIYIRVGNDSKVSYQVKKNFKIGKGFVLKDGKDVTIISTGSFISIASEVTNLLIQKNISVRLISMPTIKPIDVDIIKDSIKCTKAIFSIEEHSIIGGLGSALSEIIAESGQNTIFKMFGFPDKPIKFYGKQAYLIEKNNLSSNVICSEIHRCLKRKIK